MPQNTTITVPRNTWTLLTNSDVTSLSFQVVRATNPVQIKATVGAVAPTNADGAFTYGLEGEYNIKLSDMYPGLAATRVYAFCRNEATITVSHA